MAVLLSRLEIKVSTGVSKNTSPNLLPREEEENTDKKKIKHNIALVKE